MGKLPGFSECSPSAMSIYSSTFLVGLPPGSLLHYRTGITVYTHGDDDWLTDPETEHRNGEAAFTLHLPKSSHHRPVQHAQSSHRCGFSAKHIHH